MGVVVLESRAGVVVRGEREREEKGLFSQGKHQRTDAIFHLIFYLLDWLVSEKPLDSATRSGEVELIPTRRRPPDENRALLKAYQGSITEANASDGSVLLVDTGLVST